MSDVWFICQIYLAVFLLQDNYFIYKVKNLCITENFKVIDNMN